MQRVIDKTIDLTVRLFVWSTVICTTLGIANKLAGLILDHWLQ